MRRNLLAVVVLLFTLSSAVASEEIVKDDFESQTEGQQLSELSNWKFITGWIKPEYGTIVAEKGNKFLRMRGDIFAPKLCNLTDKLIFRFKIRATGSDEELGGLNIHPADGKSRYDILCTYKNGAIVLAQDIAGKRETIEKASGIKSDTFQEVVVELERLAAGVKFTVSLDGAKVIEKVETQPMPFLNESFYAGFFTYNQKTVDFDDADFIQGK